MALHDSQVNDRHRLCLSPPLTPGSGVTLRDQATTALRPGVATQAVDLRAQTLPQNTKVGGARTTAKSPSSNSASNEAGPAPRLTRWRLTQQQPNALQPKDRLPPAAAAQPGSLGGSCR
ncbi:hypothetical protein MRX96_044151 [Rhipicephalus microplus]